MKMESNAKRLIAGKTTRISLAMTALVLCLLLTVLLFPFGQMPGDPPAAYFYYGHFFIVVYLLVLFAMVLSPVIAKRRHRFALLALVTIAAIADIFVYWLGEFFTAYLRQHAFFYVELPALLLMLLVFALHAFVYRKDQRSQEPGFVFIFFSILLTGILCVFFSPILQILRIVMTLALIVLSAYSSNEPSRRISKEILIPGLLIGLLLIGSRFAVYQPHILHGPLITTVDPLPQKSNTEVRLHVFNTGFNRMSKILSPGTPPWRPAPAFVIAHPSRGLIVFDCGLSPGVARHGEAALPMPMPLAFESRGAVGRTLDEQMKQVGMDPLKVSYVVLSHLHEDHTGTVSAFKNAEVITGPGANNNKLKGSIFRSLSSLEKTKTALGESWDLLGDGSILLIAGGGHTPEDLLLWLNSPNGPILLTGDVVVHWDWLRSNDVERVAINKSRIAESRNQIRKLLQVVPEMVLYPGHDTANLKQNRADIIIHNPSYFKTDSWPALKNK